MISLARLKVILDDNFGEPFLEEGHVRAEHTINDTLKVYIGRRDIEIDGDGKVLGAGTSLSESEVNGKELREFLERSGS